MISSEILLIVSGFCANSISYEYSAFYSKQANSFSLLELLVLVSWTSSFVVRTSKTHTALVRRGEGIKKRLALNG